MKRPANVTLLWHLLHVGLALVGLIGNLAYRERYAVAEANRELANRLRRK